MIEEEIAQIIYQSSGTSLEWIQVKDHYTNTTKSIVDIIRAKIAEVENPYSGASETFSPRQDAYERCRQTLLALFDTDKEVK